MIHLDRKIAPLSHDHVYLGAAGCQHCCLSLSRRNTPVDATFPISLRDHVSYEDFLSEYVERVTC